VLNAVPLARNGYHQYTHINQIWDMQMPTMPDDNVTQGVLGGDVDYDGHKGTADTGLENTAKNVTL
jgi:hypothetical protein